MIKRFLSEKKMKFNKGIFSWIILVIVLFNSCNFKNSSIEKNKIRKEEEREWKRKKLLLH